MENRKVRRFYDKLRVINLYILAFFILFVIQKYTIGLIPGIKNIILFNKLYFYEVLFAITSIVAIKLFVRIDAPRLSKDDKFFTVKKIRDSHN